jgi:hypothetical protein
MKRACVTCTHFDADQSLKGWGHCTRYPPRVLLQHDGDREQTLWPEVSHTNRCGEWRNAESADDAQERAEDWHRVAIERAQQIRELESRMSCAHVWNPGEQGCRKCGATLPTRSKQWTLGFDYSTTQWVLKSPGGTYSSKHESRADAEGEFDYLRAHGDTLLMVSSEPENGK